MTDHVAVFHDKTLHCETSGWSHINIKGHKKRNVTSKKGPVSAKRKKPQSKFKSPSASPGNVRMGWRTRPIKDTYMRDQLQLIIDALREDMHDRVAAQPEWFAVLDKINEIKRIKDNGPYSEEFIEDIRKLIPANMIKATEVAKTIEDFDPTNPKHTYRITRENVWVDKNKDRYISYSSDAKGY